MKKIQWYDGNVYELKGNSCLSIKGEVKLFIPNEKIEDDVWLESRDLQTIIDYAKYIRDKNSSIQLICNSIWYDEERIDLFLQHKDLFHKVVLMPYVRGKELNTMVYLECLQKLTDRFQLIPKDRLIVDLVMATTISSETKTMTDFESIIENLHKEGYQTVISLDNYEFHSKDVDKESNLQILSQLLSDKKVDYLLSLKK